jgi:hypothetical protein
LSAARLRESALTVLRRHHVAEDELTFETPKEDPSACVIKGHRIRIHVDERRADFSVRQGRWSGARQDYPSSGSFVSAFEDALDRAISDRWRE